jgi:filamentous hemagglutinin family protein
MEALLAEIITDGSMGLRTALTGPEYNISSDLGLVQGSNLFHSFELFNLHRGEIANFTGDNNINNIIARINSGQTAFINGIIRTSIPEVDIYLANRHGFVFGEHARLDLNGSFHITTATEFIFNAGQSWRTDFGDAPLLATAAPIAFGFLTPGQDISILGSQLATSEDKILSISAARIIAENARLKADSGHLNLLAIQQAIVSPNIIAPKIQSGIILGDISLSRNTSLDIGREGGGSIAVYAHNLILDSSSIFVNASVPGKNSNLSIQANNLELKNGSKLDSRSYGAGRGGFIDIQVANDARLTDSDILTTGTQKDPDVTGDAGDIYLIAGNIVLYNASITTKTYGIGSGGDITIIARDNLYASSPKTGLGISPSVIQASTEDGGDAGRIYIRANNLSLVDNRTGIDNNSKGSGHGGSIQLHITDTLGLADGAFISADSKDVGYAGNISINARSLKLNQASISTTALESDGGNIIINANQKLKLEQSLISAHVSGGSGNGGNLLIGNPCQFELWHSQLRANASFGNGGLILTISGAQQILQHSTIDASSEFGVDGKVQIDVPNVERSTLPAQFLDASMKIKPRCAVRTDEDVSRFTVRTRLGLPLVPDDLQTYIPGRIKN